MEGFRKVDVKSLELQPFVDLDEKWMLVTAAKKDGSYNTMTASWGSFGILWNKCVTTITVRPQRYTREFIDDSMEYSLCFFSENSRKHLEYLGEVSGREVPDKISNTGLQVEFHDGIPYFPAAERVVFCRVLLNQLLDKNAYKSSDILKEFYPEQDYHHYYAGEIIGIYDK